METKKRHHFVPRFILKGFAEPTTNLVWVYKKGDERPFRCSPDNIGFQKHFYTIRQSDGSADTNSVEHLYSLLESSAAAVIRKIAAREPIDGQDKANLSHFMGFQFTRVPKFRRFSDELDRKSIKHLMMTSARDEKGFEAFIRDFELRTGKKVDDPETHRQFWIDGAYEITVRPEASLEVALKLANDNWQAFAQMNWELLIASGQLFVTTDNPVFWCDPIRPSATYFDIGLLDRRVQVSFPLTRNVALLASWTGKQGYTNANERAVRDINRRSIIGCSDFVYSSENEDWIFPMMKKFDNKNIQEPNFESFKAFWDMKNSQKNGSL